VIKIQGPLNREVYAACSGGVDSMAVVDFLSRSHKVNLMFFDHGNELSKKEFEFVADFCADRPKIQMHLGVRVESKTSGESWEEYWRNQRYAWFHSFHVPIITCHHLDDCVETWIWSSLHGEGKIIPYAHKNVIRPFRENRKSEFLSWCERNSVPWFTDESNTDTEFMRNFIRHELVERCLVVNPGLHKVIRKKIMNDPILVDKGLVE
jgi:tRNA(Ile)-lysidine synthase